MNIAAKLAQERRARLAAERLLEQKQSELFHANSRLGDHARALSNQIVEKRREVKDVRTAAATLETEKHQVMSELRTAESKVQIAERRLWDSIEAIQDGFAVFDKNSQLISANKAFLVGFDGLDEVRPGVTYPRLLELISEEGIVDIGDQTRAEWREEMLDRWQSPDIETRTVKLWNQQYIKLVDSRAEGGDTVSLALNITETINHQADLNAARNRAEAASRAKSAFLANMSHEIRTPMNGVVGMADILADTPLNEEQKLYIETIKNSGEALLVIINDILDYSKIEAEKLTLHPSAFDLEQNLHEIMTLLQPSTQDKGIDLLIDFDSLLPTTYVGDPGRVRQILTNLIGNAVKFTNKGYVSVRVRRMSDLDEPEARLLVEIQDTGIGIAEEMIDFIFGEFNQVEDDRNRKFEGTGLGLAITKQLVELMGGKIWATSVEGKGSCFHFELNLPVTPSEVGIDLLVAKELTQAYIFEDQEHLAQVVTTQLGSLGIPVKSGQSLSLALAGPTPSFFIVGASYGGADAEKIVAEILQTAPTTPILMITSGKSAAPNVSGATHCLQHPIRRRDLHEVLSDIAAKATQIREARALMSAPPATAAAVVDATPEPEPTPFAPPPEPTAPLVIEAMPDPAPAPEPEPSPAPAPLAAEIDVPTPSAPQVEASAEVATTPPMPEIVTPELPPQAELTVEPAHVEAAVETHQLAEPTLSAPALPIAEPTPPEPAIAEPVLADPAEPQLTAAAPVTADATVSVPAAPTSAPTVEPVLPDPTPPAEPETNKLRVLAAEDNRTNQLVFRKMVKGLNIDLQFANNGREAIEQFQSFNPHVIFMDISMPEVDGKEATLEIRKLEAAGTLKRTPIIALTAHAMPQDEAEILESGLDEYSTKPLRKAVIYDKLSKHAPEGLDEIFPPETGEA